MPNLIQDSVRYFSIFIVKMLLLCCKKTLENQQQWEMGENKNIMCRLLKLLMYARIMAKTGQMTLKGCGRHQTKS